MSDKPTTLPIPADLAATIAGHLELFEGFTMTAAAPEAAQVPPPAVQQPDQEPSEPEKSTDFVDDETGEKYAFPAKTPLSAMTDAQRAEYWRHKSRKHETEKKALLSGDQPKPKPPQQRGEGDQQVDAEQIKQEAERDALGRYAPMAIRSEFRAAFAGTRTKEQVDTLLEGIDLNKFLTRKGDVDTDKVIQYVDSIAPKGAAGSNGPDMGQGHRGAGHVSKAAEGQAEAERRYGKKQ